MISVKKQVTSNADIILAFLRVTLLYNGSPYHIGTSPLICRANQLTGFYMIGSFITKVVRFSKSCSLAQLNCHWNFFVDLF